MSRKSLIYLGAFVGSTIGGYLPALFGISLFSITSIITSGIGAMLGIWIAYNLSR